MKKLVLRVVCFLFVSSFLGSNLLEADAIRIEQDEESGAISVYRAGESEPILTQNAKADFRPYIHPIVAPDGNGVLTEFSPGHHKHQTGLYWGFTRVNGRDYFHHPEGDYWRRVSASILSDEDEDQEAKWQTVYDLLDASGQPILRETQTWSIECLDDEYLLDLEWTGEALEEITIGKYNYGGMFLRMPWKKGITGEVVNGARQKNQRAEGQRAHWVDVGMQVEGRDDLAHITIFDHPKNSGFPQPWRVDGQMGVGPVRARLGNWQIKKGEKATIRHQLVVYTGKLNDLSLTNRWSEWSGQRGTSALWGLAQQEGRSAEFLTPEKAVETMSIQEGFEVNAYAAEPMITQPMAFCWDDRGRMWVAENRDYETRGRGFSNSGDSRILILEDTDRDGVADKRTVFAEGVPFPAGIAVGFDGLWLGAPPNLLFIPDRDGDDKAEMDDIEVRLTGWGIRDRHETLNSFHWGPDGWLYGCQGFATPSRVGKPAGKGRLYKHRDPFPKKIDFADEPVDINGGVWRYHPTKERFEVVAHGFSNPWGLDYDAKGQLFITACVIPHLWHVIPGGIYHRQGGSHFNAHVYSDIRTIADHRHRSAHGGARVYLSDAFPEKYKDRIFMANIHEHAVLTDILEPSGSGFIGREGDDFLLANNAQWIGFSVEIGPEGAVYILDWHDADICGKEVVHKETGRIFRITPKESLAKDWDGRYEDMSTMPNDALVDLQLSESAWHARRARLILQYRSTQGKVDAEVHDSLRNIFVNESDSDYRLRALWALHVTGGLSTSDLEDVLNDEDQHIRAWAIQLLCEDEQPSEETLQRFAVMAREDESAVVRLYLAAALQRIEHDQRWPIVNALVTHTKDVEDHNIPKMIWFGLEPMVVENPDRALEVAVRSQIPMITRYISRRLSSDEQFEPVIAAIGDNRHSQQNMLLGLQDALDGNFDVAAPSNWNAIQTRIAGTSNQAIALDLSQRFGSAVAADKLLETLKDQNSDIDQRRQALISLAGQREAELPELLVAMLNDDQMRRDAIRTVAAYDEEDLAKTLLDRYATLSDDDKLEVVHALASRSNYGWELTQAIKRGDVPRRDVPAYVARLLRRVVGNGFVEVWGPIDALSEDKEKAFAKYRNLLNDEQLAKADPGEGRVVFRRTCAACHKMYDEGGAIGPDITGANRTNLEYLLGNILTPSAIIQDDYKMHLVLTDEGRVYSGIPADEDTRQLRLRVANEEEPVVIPKSKIESREVASVSMMPDGILNTLSDEEVMNLIAYLKSLRQVNLPTEEKSD